MMIRVLRMGGLFLADSFLLLGPGGLQSDNLSLAAEAQDLQKVTLKIDGISCGSCIAKIRSALSKVPGVKTAQVKVKSRWIFFADYSDARAIVECELGKTTVDELIKAVEGAGDSYKTTLIE